MRRVLSSEFSAHTRRSQPRICTQRTWRDRRPHRAEDAARLRGLAGSRLAGSGAGGEPAPARRATWRGTARPLLRPAPRDRRSLALGAGARALPARRTPPLASCVPCSRLRAWLRLRETGRPARTADCESVSRGRRSGSWPPASPKRHEAEQSVEACYESGAQSASVDWGAIVGGRAASDACVNLLTKRSAFPLRLNFCRRGGEGGGACERTASTI